MDHLPIPTYNVYRQPFKVRYLYDKRYTYDGLGLVDFPARKGFLVFPEHPCIGQSDDDYASFLQAWLWFGLLREVLAITSPTMEDLDGGEPQSRSPVLLRSEHDDIFLTTKSLHNYMLGLSVVGAIRDQPACSLQHYDSSLSTVTTVINRCLSTPVLKAQIVEATSFDQLPYSCLILVSVQLLVATLNSYRSVLFSDPADLEEVQPLLIESCPLLFEMLLQDAGHCPSDIASFPEDIRIKYFYSLMAVEERSLHARCSRHRCVLTSSNDAVFVPKHTGLNCACCMVERHCEIDERCKSQSVELATFRESQGDGNRVLSICRTHDTGMTGLPFIAISHVRSCGLGNSTGRALPYCQLAYLQTLAEQIVEAEEAVAFYIDTMCLPPGRRARTKALRHIPEVFATADAVVVLDRLLLSTKVGSALECILYIFRCSWRKRLWTLQEGAIARKLWFVFSNGMWELGNILTDLDRAGKLSILTNSEKHVVADSIVLSALTCLDKDIKLVKICSGSGIELSDAQKLKVHKYLRLGYLSLSRLRHFRETHEKQQIPLMLNTLLHLYDNETRRQAPTASEALCRLSVVIDSPIWTISS